MKHFRVLRLVALAATVPLTAVALTADAGRPLREYVQVVDQPYRRVGLTVTVTDRQGRPVRGLTRDDFRVFEDGREVRLEDFGLEGGRMDRPLSVAILLDFSGSMGRQVRKVREAARALLSGLRPRDEIMVAKFNDQITILQRFTGDPADGERTLRNLGRAYGGTALFRAVSEILRDLRNRAGRKIILVVSDGQDNDVASDQHVLQSLFLQDLLRLAFRTQTVVYGIRPGMSSFPWLPFEGFVEETGGQLLYSGGDLERLFARLGEEFLSQYYLAYDIDPKLKEGKRRRIRVEVSRQDVVIKTMRGFFTPRPHLETLLHDLDDADANLRLDAAYELGFNRDPKALRGLRQALADRDEGVRKIVVDSLARLGAVEAIPDLIARLGDRDRGVREAAAGGLTLFGPAAVPDLVREVERRGKRRRIGPRLLNAARLLGEVGDDRAVAPLAVMLERGADEARVAAAGALGALGLSQGIPPLRKALLDRADPVRRAAVRAIVAIAGAAARAVVEDYIRREPDEVLREEARSLLRSL